MTNFVKFYHSEKWPIFRNMKKKNVLENPLFGIYGLNRPIFSPSLGECVSVRLLILPVK